MKSLKSRKQENNAASQAGAAIAEVRAKQGLTQYELGLLMDMGRQHICDIERGETNISLRTLQEIAERLGCKVDIKLRKIRKKPVGSQNAMPTN